MVLKKFTSILNKKPAQDDTEEPGVDTPEANAARGVRLFCESGSANSGEEVLHLPTIVESAVATPAAAAAAAGQIRKFLAKENLSRPHVQYNAIMLIRILADNPGPSFTKNVDSKFVDTVKQLLRRSQDPSVRQILIETLNALDREKAYDTNLNELFAMWRKEQGLGAQPSRAGPRAMDAPPWDPHQFPAEDRSRRGHKGLPPPAELAARIEEARTSAKLLLQLVQSTPPAELFGNDLIKEFAGRCQSAQRSVQAYINCDSPPPDDDTMLTLIETNEQLSLAASKHQRAVLQARRALGGTTPPSTTPPPNAAVSAPPPPSRTPVSHNETPVLPPISTSNGNSTLSASILPTSLQAAPNRRKPPAAPAPEDPFSDENETYAPPPGPPNHTFTSNSHREGESDGYNSSYTGPDIVSPPMPSSESANPGSTTRQRGPGFEEGEVSPIESRTAITYRY
jgi:hypothetical protein